MSTYTNLLFHIIYSTKYRKPSIDPLWQDELYAYIGGILRDNRGVLLKRNPWARAHGYTISSLRDYGTAKQRRSVENTSVMRVLRISSLPVHDESAIDVDGLSRHMCSPIR